MKSFIVSLVTIFIITTLIAINSVAFVWVADDLIEMAEKASLDYESVSHLRSEWEGRRLWLSLTTSGKEIDKIDTTLCSIESIVRNGDEDEFEKEKSLLIYYIEQMRNDEILSLDRFF
ncbi:MAG: DUF4363 family protein [Clostridia bacterium]|nr:DUF4363 family protein [Clostridia bacterium]